MQKLLIIIIILLNHNQPVKCDSFLDFVRVKMTGIKALIFDVYSTLRTGLENTVKYMRNPERPPLFGSRRNRSHLVISNDQFEVLKHKNLDLNFIYSRSAHVLTTPQLAATHGRVVETHVTYTMDGYILTLHRLHSRISRGSEETPKRTILLHHGLLGSSADWILLGPKKSLPYILSDAGHDVWLANARGNYYSRSHVSMNMHLEEFWNFSWQEIGERDLPAILNYIRRSKNSTQPIDYIGHSLGATALLVLLSVNQNYDSFLRIAFLLAPIAFMDNTQGPLKKLAAMGESERKLILGTKEFMPTRRVTSYLMSKNMCHDTVEYCRNPLFFLVGGPLQAGTRTPEFMEQLQDYVPAGGSSKTISHCIESIITKKFHKYGKPDWNFKLKYITTPVLIFSSNDDFVSNTTDNQMLYLSLLNPIGHIIIKDQNFSHTEFAWGYNADAMFYYKIRDLIDLGPDVNKIGNET